MGARERQSRPRPRVVVHLGAGTGTRRILRKAVERGLAVVAVGPDPGAPGFEHAIERIECPLDDPSSILEGLRSLAESRDLVAVFHDGWGELSRVAAEVRTALGIPGCPPDVVDTLLAPGRLFERCAALGIAHPVYQEVGSIDEIRPAELGLPCWARPARLGDTAPAPRFVPELDLLEPAMAEVSRDSSHGRVHLERAVEGDEVILLAVVDDERLQPIALIDAIGAIDRQGRVRPRARVVPSKWADTSVGDSMIAQAEHLARALDLRAVPLVLSARCRPDEPPSVTDVRLVTPEDRVLHDLLPASSTFDVVGYLVDGLTGGHLAPIRATFAPAALRFGRHDEASWLFTATTRAILDDRLNDIREVAFG